MIRNKQLIIFFCAAYFFSLCPFILAQEDAPVFDRKKRDPFVALVNSNGKIKSDEELFPTSQKKLLSMNMTISAIIWDEKRPLAFINGKVYAEGAKISEELILEKIYPNSVVVNEQGNLITIKLRRNSQKE